MAKIYRVDPVVSATATNKTKDQDTLTRMYDEFTASPAFLAEFPKYRGIPLLRGFGGRSAAFRRGSERWIRLGSNRSEATMLHEIAHHACDLHPERYGPRTSHGPGFAAAYLDVVTLYQGERGREALIAAYAQERIKVYRDGERVLLSARPVKDPEVLLALAGMATASEARKARAERARRRKEERRKRLEEQAEREPWMRFHLECQKLQRHMAAKKAWETRRRRAALTSA